MFRALDNKFGPLEVDMFATFLNNQYISWRPNPFTIAADTLERSAGRLCLSSVLPDWEMPPETEEGQGFDSSTTGPLMALVEASRSSELAALDLRFYSLRPEGLKSKLPTMSYQEEEPWHSAQRALL
jgi:hypothetical protein